MRNLRLGSLVLVDLTSLSSPRFACLPSSSSAMAEPKEKLEVRHRVTQLEVARAPHLLLIGWLSRARHIACGCARPVEPT